MYLGFFVFLGLSNELIFILHTLTSLLFLLGALSLGKSALTTYIASSWLFANFFVIKQIELFSLRVTAGDVYTIGAMYGLSLLQERFGKEEALNVIRTSFFLLVLGTFFAVLHLAYAPSTIDTTHDAFSIVLSSTPRLMLASIATFLISSRLDVFIFQKLATLSSLSFAIRSICTVMTVTVVDTALFTVLGLYGLVDEPIHVFIVSVIVKIGTVIFTSPFLKCVDSLFPSSTPVSIP